MQIKQKPVFPGGIHPTDGSDKELSMEAAVQPYWPETVTILSEQSFGGKCRILVNPGDSVKEGQLIGEPDAFMAAPLHASVTGTVLEVKEVANQAGTSWHASYGGRKNTRNRRRHIAMNL